MTKSPQRTTAEALVEAFNRMDIDTIIAFRHQDCLRYILPAALGHKPQTNAEYSKSLQALKPIFHHFTLVVHDILEDREAGRICMYLTARADTLAGAYVNEYQWTLDFDESGTKIVKWTEFVDALVNRDFWPKLKDAMERYQKTKAAAEKLPPAWSVRSAAAEPETGVGSWPLCVMRDRPFCEAQFKLDDQEETGDGSRNRSYRAMAARHHGWQASEAGRSYSI